MKTILLLAVLLYGSVGGRTQTLAIELCAHKTTTLIFPLKIVHIDRGSSQIIVQPIKEADHVLLVKAADTSLSETNLSVIMSDGSVYSINARFCNNPQQMLYKLPILNSANTRELAERILDNPTSTRVVCARNQDIEIKLTGLYVGEGKLYFQVEWVNHGPIDYDVEMIRFFIKDTKKARRASVQQVDLSPLQMTGAFQKIRAFESKRSVWLFDKFTLGRQQRFFCTIREKSGGRHLSLRIRPRKLLHAVLLPSSELD